MNVPIVPMVSEESLIQPTMQDTSSDLHIAIIMDGNGRWAQHRGQMRLSGHKIGAEVARNITKEAPNLGIKYLTLYAFSTENWQRGHEEVSGLMELLRWYLNSQIKQLVKEQVALRIIGDVKSLSMDIQKLVEKAEKDTSKIAQPKLYLNLALSYGSRDEILRSIKKINQDVIEGKLDINQLNEATFNTYLDTKNQPEPDLLIRTGGDLRLSNFLLWQSAYTELYFTPTLWPDFTKEELKTAIDQFHSRNRRFGK